MRSLIPRTPMAKMSAAIAALAVLLRFPSFISRLFDPDEAAIGVQAMVVRSGGTLYSDVFDRKPPLPPLIYAAFYAVTRSTDVRPLRVLVAIGLAAAGVMVAREVARKHGMPAGWWAGVLFVAGAMAMLPGDAGGANYAHFALLPATAAMLWSRRHGDRWALSAGVALGLAVLCRQSWLLAVPAAGYSAYCASRWRGALILLAATVSTVLTTGLYAPLRPFWRWNVTNAPGFVFAPTGLLGATGRGVASVLLFIGFHATAAGCLWLWWRRRRADSQRHRPGDTDLWLWLFSGLLAVAAGLRFFGHYWLQVLPPLVILAAPVAAQLAGRARRRAIVGVAVPATLAFAMLLVPGTLHAQPAPQHLAGWVRAHTTRTQRVFVWGSYPEVLIAADRLPAGALVDADFVTGRSGGRSDPRETLRAATPGALKILMNSLVDDPPELILDTSTAKGLAYRRYPLTIIPQLGALVEADYVRVAVVDGVTIWQRRAGRPMEVEPVSTALWGS